MSYHEEANPYRHNTEESFPGAGDSKVDRELVSKGHRVSVLGG